MVPSTSQWVKAPLAPPPPPEIYSVYLVYMYMYMLTCVSVSQLLCVQVYWMLHM